MSDLSYTLHLDPILKRKGKFKEGNIPWNIGKSWKEQGITGEERERRLAKLQEGNKNRIRSHKPTHSKPVIQTDEYGNRLHWYESSEAAARKLCITGRNIRKVCDGERHTCGGYRWRWDERFK